MKLSDYKNLVKEQKEGMSKLEISLSEVLETRDEINRDLGNARKRLARKKSSTFYPTKLASRIIKALREGNILSSILIEEIGKAVNKNKEFGRDEYKQTLYQVAQEKDIYKLIPAGSGWEIQIKPQIVFEEEAGQTNDWAKGIIEYRKVLKTKVGNESSNLGEKATRFWATKVFGTSLQTKTFRGRLELSGRKAPYWQLLNNGSTSMLSDRPDGSYNPYPTEPTDFIGNAERAIRAEFRELMLPEKERWFQEAKELEEQIETRVQIRDRITQNIQSLSTEVRLNERALRSFGQDAEYIDKNKFADVFRRLRAGEEFENPIVELTKRGSSKRIRRSVAKLEGLLYE